LMSDVRYSLRMARKQPGFTIVVAIMLGVGVGGTTTIFSVVNALLLSPLPYPDADRLVIMWQGRRGASVEKDWFSAGHFTDIQSQTSAFESLALVEGASSIMTGRGRPAQVGWVQAQSSYLQMLGARATVGRILDDGDDQPSGDTVALLANGLWQRSFGGDPSFLGQTITLNGNDYEIVGVLAPDVLLDNEVMPTWGGIGRVDVILSAPFSEETLSNRVNEGYNIVGKLKPGVTLTRAQAQLDLVAARIQQLHENDPNSGFFIKVLPLIDEVVGSVRHPLLLLLASVGSVLLIACANVANLLLARAVSRHRELGVRAALGAERGRLVRQLLTESALLAAIGGALGMGLTRVGLSVLQELGGVGLPRLTEIRIDGRVLGFSLAITTVTCLLFGWLPAWRASRIDLADTIKSGGRGAVRRGALWSPFNVSSTLVIAEVGLSIVLLIGGSLLTRSFVALHNVDPGFDANGRLTFRLDLRGAKYSARAARIDFYDQLMVRLRAMPGVVAVGAASDVPFDGGVSWNPISIDDYVPPQGDEHEIVTEFRVATPGYFEAMGIPVIRGRGFTDADRSDGARVALIDQHFADTYFPERDPVGMRVSSWQGAGMTVVGVVGTVKHEALDRMSRVTTYVPHAQLGYRGMYVVIRASRDPNALAASVMRTVEAMDDDLAVLDVRPMPSRIAGSLAVRRFVMALLQALSMVALLLACVGIYGLLSYRVNEGTHELGLRMALGAPPRRVLHLVLGHGLGLIVTGVVLGIVVALLLTRLLRSMLFGVHTADPWTFTTVATGLLVTGLLACYFPARRATMVDPVGSIRGE